MKMTLTSKATAAAPLAAAASRLRPAAATAVALAATAVRPFAAAVPFAAAAAATFAFTPHCDRVTKKEVFPGGHVIASGRRWRPYRAAAALKQSILNFKCVCNATNRSLCDVREVKPA
jgi:hypothetical protein